MIVEFSVKNFRSINSLQTISFAATNLDSSIENADIDTNNISIEGNQKIVKTIGIYGANASGKSNIINAFEYFAELIGELPSPESRLSKLAQPFLYQEESENTESYFQIILSIKEKKYRYGFTVKKNTSISNEVKTSNEIITNEWLYGPKNKNQIKYFTRTGLDLDKAYLPEGENIAPLEYEHSLFLTHAASYNKDICAEIRNTIKGTIAYKYSLRNDFYRFHSIRQLENKESKPQFIAFLKSFGLDYEDLIYKNDDEFARNNYFPLDKLYVIKNACYDTTKNVVLNMQHHESEGTRKLFDLAGLLIVAFNVNKNVLLIIDEIDSNFHPSLLIKLIQMFNDPQINKSNAQLLFTSHDTNLMSPSLMRRDQFYFAEKDTKESTRLYSLAELKGIRKDADFAKHYLAGFYGSLPVLSQYIDGNSKQYEGSLGN